MADSTRVAIEISSEVKFRVERLHEPERLVIDLQDTRSRLGPRTVNSTKVADPLVRQIRVSQMDPKTTRVVLDLEVPVNHEVSQLTNPTRLIVEVRPRSPLTAPVAPSRTAAERIGAAVPAAAAKPEPTSPEPAKPEPAKPEPAKPEPAKPEPAKPEPAKPEPAKPEPASPDPDGTPRPARPTASGARTLSRALGLKIGRVVIDPGHGAHDHGTTGPTGLTEKELVLDVALRLGELVQQRLGSDVVYTRSTDVFIPLEQRTAIANEHRADLFLSIHANSSPIAPISGAEVFYLNFTSSRDALDTAARENAGHGKSIFELRELIQKIALKDKIDESREFATRVQASLSSTWSKINPGARNRGVKKAPFVVLIGANMPSVLAEIGFISNPRDEAALRRPDQRQRIAEALFSGLNQYASTLGQTRPASLKR